MRFKRVNSNHFSPRLNSRVATLDIGCLCIDRLIALCLLLFERGLLSALLQLTNSFFFRQQNGKEAADNHVQPQSAKINGKVRKRGRGRPRKLEVEQVDRKGQLLDGKSHGKMSEVNFSTYSATVDLSFMDGLEAIFDNT